MTTNQNFLFDHPELFDAVWETFNSDTKFLCQTAFDNYCRVPPTSVLDVGCGTGYDLAALPKSLLRMGVDVDTRMIEHAKRRHPDIDFRICDASQLHLSRRFDVVLSLGSVLNYFVSNEKLESVFAGMRRHCKDGGLLIIEIVNGASFLGRDTFEGMLSGGRFGTFNERTLKVGDSYYRCQTKLDFDHTRQVMLKRRRWLTEDGQVHQDLEEYRLIFPLEMQALLERHQFDLLGQFDNRKLEPSDMTGFNQVVVARAAVRSRS